jgi:DNA-binding response OmpR family regulator
LKILIVEDDENILSFLKRGFLEENFLVDSIDNGKEGEYLILTNSYDLVILDWMLPFKSGVEIIKSIRKKAIKTPIIMLTAKDEIKNRVLGLNSGADDYLPKPFSFEELLARVKAIQRRILSQGNSEIKIKNITVNLATKSVLRDNIKFPLRAKEYHLLLFFIKHKNSIVSNRMIEEEIYKSDEFINSNTIAVTIYNLRKKIGKEIIKSFRGLGYRLES